MFDVFKSKLIDLILYILTFSILNRKKKKTASTVKNTFLIQEGTNWQ